MYVLSVLESLADGVCMGHIAHLIIGVYNVRATVSHIQLLETSFPSRSSSNTIFFRQTAMTPDLFLQSIK